MTMATPGNNSQIQDLLPADDDDYDPYAISNEIEAVRKEFNQKFKPLKRGVTVEETALAYNKLVSEIGGTILSLLRDTAHQQGQLAVMVDNIGDGTNEEATQLLPDDAQLLLEVIAYASETVNASLGVETITAEQRTILEAVQQRVAAAKQLVEESTLEDDEEDEPDNDSPELPEAD